MPVVIIPSRRAGTSPASTTIFSDSLAETSTVSITSHIPETGSGWTQYTRHAYSGTIQVIGAGGYASASVDAAEESVGAMANAIGDYPTASYAVEIVANGPNDTSDDTFEIITHFQDTDNFYFATLLRSGASPDWSWGKMVGGVATSFDSGNHNLSLTADRTYRIECRMTGGTAELKLYMDETLLSTISDSALPSAGRGGFGLGRFNGSGIQDVDSRWKILDCYIYRLS